MVGVGAKPFVDAKLAQRAVVVFAKRGVPECSRVEDVLGRYPELTPAVYELVEIERRQDVSEIETYFQTMCLTDTRAVPQLFVQGKYVGGEREILRLHEFGELKKILANAAAKK